ncbi:MAG: type IX secretion system sortase PorU [bacterium]|nr:type IX secretion system sortase PorU [bacterium]
MNALIRKSLVSLAAFCVVTGSSRAGKAQEVPVFRLSGSSARGCTIEFNLSDLELDSIRTPAGEFIRIGFRGGRAEAETGEPMIPVATAVIAIPPEGGVRVSLSRTLPGPAFEKARLLPGPRLETVDGLPAERYEPGPGYAAGGNASEPLFDVSDPQILGPYRVVHLRFRPVRYDAGTGALTVFSGIRVSAEFEQPAASFIGQSRSADEAVFRNVLLNYTEARTWKKPERPVLRRTGRVRRAGEYYKIPISSDAVYSISGATLKNAGVDIAAIDPATLKIYNNGGKALPLPVRDARPDSLVENPIRVVGAEDGRFDASDVLLFFGRGPSGWQTRNRVFEHYLNAFTESNVYWLAFNDGKPGLRIQKAPAPAPESATPTDTFTDYQFLQNDKGNPIEAGMFWYTALFQTGDPEPVSIPIPAYDPAGNDTPFYRILFKGEDMDDTVTQTFFITVNGRSIGSHRIINAATQLYQFSDPAGLRTTGNALGVHFSATLQAAKGYLGWLEIRYRRYLAARDNQLKFFSPQAGGAWRYRLTGFTSEPEVWDVTDPASIRALSVVAEDGAYWVSDAADSGDVRTYFCRSGSSFPSPPGIEKDTFADLRNPENGCDLLIVAPAAFMEAAERYARFKRDADSLEVFTADIAEVFDEFGWGIRDPAALRDFVRTAYDTWRKQPSFLLLFGDGHYDYRNRLPGSKPNWIPPFEIGGTQTLWSPAVDDWFAWVSGDDALAELAVGRATVETAEQANTVVDKWIRYQSEPERGDWRGLITIVADDEISPNSSSEMEHVRDSETLAAAILPPAFNQRKIYMTEYPVEIQTRRLKPQAEDDLIRQINAGTLIVNYTGHANKSVWAHEWIFQQQASMKRLENGGRLPLFFAATCEFGLFDDPKEQSFCEDLLAAPAAGGIAVIGATRFSFSGENSALNYAFMDPLLRNLSDPLRIGEAMRIAKMSTGNRTADQKYVIIGDPSLRLAAPRQEMVFTSVEPDTLRALGRVRVEGEVRKNGVRWEDFSGRVRVQASDSKKSIRYRSASGASASYALPGNPMFRGENEVTGGRFAFEFIVPKDITYGGTLGRLSGYAWNESTDGFGARDGLITGGSAVVDDRQGPDIRIGFDGLPNFMPGDMVAGDPVLSAEIEDSQTGINLTGELGHKITLALDDGLPVDVSAYFSYDAGSYLRGRVVYPLTGVAPGVRSLTLKAWDNANNSASRTVEFRAVAGDGLILDKLLNYPNPFSGATQFTFEVSRSAEAEIRIYTVDGRRIRRIEGIPAQPGFNWVDWDGRDERGDALSNGVYLYTVTVRAGIGGQKAEASEVGKMIRMR